MPEGGASTSRSILTATKGAAPIPLQAALVCLHSGDRRGRDRHHLTTVISPRLQLINRSQCTPWPSAGCGCSRYCACICTCICWMWWAARGSTASTWKGLTPSCSPPGTCTARPGSLQSRAAYYPVIFPAKLFPPPFQEENLS